jgi:hypothetical protein
MPQEKMKAKNKHVTMNIVVDPFKVKITKDGRYAVHDTSYSPSKIVGVYDRDEEDIANAAAENLNKQRKQDRLSNASFAGSLKKLSMEQFMDACIKETIQLL